MKTKIINTLKSWTFWIIFSSLIVLISAIAFKFTSYSNVFDYAYAIAISILLVIAALFIGYAIIWWPLSVLIKWIRSRWS